MRLLALDTTARAGSVALAENEAIVDARVGDASRTHGERLPGDVLDLLKAHELVPSDVDVFAVAAGPGSFTGLRVGIACIQGLALATGRRVVAVSALDALACAAQPVPADTLVAAWIDAHRGEIFAALYSGMTPLDGPSVGTPARAVESWRSRFAERPVLAIGDGAERYAHVLREAGQEIRLLDPAAPMLAPSIARLALKEAAAGRTIAPHAIVPIYIRRPDAELARHAHR
jgi:tRNA threonylcarbamoyladenosine biosynthesis protein TsaB